MKWFGDVGGFFRRPVREWLPVTAILGFLFLAGALVIRYQMVLLGFGEWGDESETIVAARMMASGLRLYDEVFNFHGPLTFLPGYLLEKAGMFSIPVHRILIVVLQWAAFLAVFFSPLWKNLASRAIAITLSATLIVVYFPDIFGHTYLYQNLAGIIVLIVLVQWTLPSLVGLPVRSAMVGLSAGLTAALPFLAVTYLPAAVLLFVGAWRRKTGLAALLGGMASLVMNLVFLGVAGSFSGYVAYHLYLNSTILSAGSSVGVFVAQVLNSGFGSPLGFVSFSVLAVSSVVLIGLAPASRFPWRIVLVALGLLSFLIRGQTWSFQTLPFWYGFLPFLSVLCVQAFPSSMSLPGRTVRWLGAIPVLFIALGLVLKLSIVLPGEADRLRERSIPPYTDFSDLARALTTPDEKVQALSFQNLQYLLAERMPASAHYFYLPWQADYNRVPILGVRSSLRQDLEWVRPKLIYADKWKVWGREDYAWEKYAADVEELLEREYRQMGSQPIYFRRDLDVAALGVDPDSGLAANPATEKEIMPVGELVKSVEVRQRTLPIPVDTLYGLSLDLATYLRKNHGTLLFTVANLEGAVLNQQRLDVTVLRDNRFHAIWFDQPLTGVRGQELLISIRSDDGVPGSSVTAWLGANADGPAHDVSINGEPSPGHSLLYRLLRARLVPEVAPLVQDRSPLGEILGGVRYQQRLVPLAEDTFVGVEIEWATYARKNSGTVRVKLQTLKGQLWFDTIVDVSKLEDNRFLAFPTEPIHGVRGTELEFVIEQADGQPGNAVTIWLRGNKDGPSYDATIDGQPLVGRSWNYRVLTPRPGAS